MVLECTKSCAAQKSRGNNSDTNNDGIDLNKSPKPKTALADNNEQAPEVSTSTADDVSSQKKSSEDVALVLSAEEEAELCANTNEESAREEPKPVTVVKPKRAKKDGSKNVWVSNIPRSTKAADLKKLFSENFKVESAKIVTNGKCFFGYISLETAEMVPRAVKVLNGFNLAGKVISVSFMRPDLKAGRASVGEQIKRGKERQKQLSLTETQNVEENKQEERNESSKEVVEDSNDRSVDGKPDSQVFKTNPEEKIHEPQRQQAKPDRNDKIIENLKKELNTSQSELRITRRRLKESNNRLEFYRSRKSELVKEVSKLESQLKLERGKINQEKEQEEKKRKLVDIRYESDRTILNKELEECKKLREYLQMKVDEIRMPPRHRSRSPIRRSPVRRAGLSGRSLPERGHGGMDKMQRSRLLHISPPQQRGYDAVQDRQCSAPSPPKITKRSPPARRSRERSPLYKANKKSKIDYPLSSYSSGPSGDNKALLTSGRVVYPPTDLLSVPPRGASWNSSYRMPYRYSPTPGQSAYPLVGGDQMHSSRFNTRSLDYVDYHKRLPGGPRKY